MSVKINSERDLAMPAQRDLPFTVPERPVVRRVRQSGGQQPAARIQPMAGFEDRFIDVVDYIVAKLT